jgi:hypothetical protein
MESTKIYSGTSQVIVLDIKNILEQEGIAYQIINKTDSSYAGLFGEIEIYVDELNAQKALELIKDLE